MKDKLPFASEIVRAAAKHGAINVRVFGSFADSSPTASSDIDLLVDLEEGRDLLDLIALKQELEAHTNRRVDIVTEGGLSPHFRDAILEQARPL